MAGRMGGDAPDHPEPDRPRGRRREGPAAHQGRRPRPQGRPRPGPHRGEGSLSAWQASTTDRHVDVRTADGKADGTVELPAEIFDVQVNIPLIHQVVVAQLAAARQGTHKTKTPRRGPRRWQEAVPAEGHRPRPPGLDPRAAVRRRWRRPRPAAARLRPADPEEDEGRRPARRPVRPGPQRPRARRRPAWSRATRRRPRPRSRALGAITERQATCSSWLERADEVTWLSLRNVARACTCSRRPAEHLRRARLATTWSSPRPRSTRSWPARRRARPPRPSPASTEAERAPPK